MEYPTHLDYNGGEYKYRCLVYPNITYQKDFTKDSYYIIMANILKHLTELRPDIFFTILTPEEMPGFQYKNTEQVIYDQPSYPNTMRCHFDTKRILEIINYKKTDWDFVYTYLPEHTLQLKNLFYNRTDCRPVFFGYSAYIEIPETTKYSMSMMRTHLNGILEMNTCGVNSQAVKDTIIKNAVGFLGMKQIARLDEILKPLPRGWDNVEGHRKNPSTSKKTIVFNHRPNSYKSYNWFLRMMDKLWEQRTDFDVWVPLADKVDKVAVHTLNPQTGKTEETMVEREYISITKFDREDYFTELSRCWVGVCGKSYHRGWANSASDGMSVGTPYLFLDEDYYKQYAGDAGIYFDTDDDFLVKINMILDDENHRKKYSKKSKKIALESTWDKTINLYNEHFILAEDKLKMLREDTDSYKKIIKFINSRKSTTKNDLKTYLGWSVRITFSTYRNRLRNENKIKLTKQGYEVI